ncbi:MAG: hypothetical protein M0P57_05950 [Syntrophales bacterium]|jgi:hypothetical protein|nr:hypothetical protein [Syntrophales bacterium]
MKQSWFRSTGVSIFLCFIWIYAPAVNAQENEVPRISKEKVKAMLGDPDLVIIDTLLPEQWELVDKKLPGAVREDPENVEKWADKYSRDKTMVIY